MYDIDEIKDEDVNNQYKNYFIQTNWERSREASVSGSAISTYASREDLMMVLENVTSILIRATYDNRQSLIR